MFSLFEFWETQIEVEISILLNIDCVYTSHFGMLPVALLQCSPLFSAQTGKRGFQTSRAVAAISCLLSLTSALKQF